MRILVTGRRGQLGRCLVAALADHDVVALAREDLDVGDARAVARTVRDVAPEVVVNAAAYTAVDRAEEEPAVSARVNAEGPRHLAEAAARASAVLVHYSTDYVFDGRSPRPYRPDDATNPLNVYGRTKLEGEAAIVATGAPAIVLRTSWVFASHGANFVRTMLRLARERDALRVVDDQRGCPTSAHRLAAATATILAAHDAPGALAALAGVHHLAADDAATWCDLARHAIACAGLDTPVAPITTDEYPLPAPRPRDSTLDSTASAARLGASIGPWRPAVNEVVAALEAAPASA